jgi:hypothetical protein
MSAIYHIHHTRKSGENIPPILQPISACDNAPAFGFQHQYLTKPHTTIVDHQRKSSIEQSSSRPEKTPDEHAARLKKEGKKEAQPHCLLFRYTEPIVDPRDAKGKC